MPPDGLGGWPPKATPAPSQRAGWPGPVKGSLRRAEPALDLAWPAGLNGAVLNVDGVGPSDPLPVPRAQVAEKVHAQRPWLTTSETD